MATEIASTRYRRQIDLFGAVGQDRIAATTVAILGLGGLGAHVAQQLAYLGFRKFVLVDHDTVEGTNLNRLIGADHRDLGRRKVKVGKRMIRRIQPTADIRTVPYALPSIDVEKAVEVADLVIGCFDNDYPRMLTTDLTSGLRIPYIDVATGIDAESGSYGGRVLVAGDARGCLHCHGELDQNEIRRATMTDEELAVEAMIYGIPVEQLRGTGPSVVSLNGVVASVAVTEAMALVTGLRNPHKWQTYYGNLGVMRQNGDRPASDCYYCSRWGSFPQI